MPISSRSSSNVSPSSPAASIRTLASEEASCSLVGRNEDIDEQGGGNVIESKKFGSGACNPGMEVPRLVTEEAEIGEWSGEVQLEVKRNCNQDERDGIEAVSIPITASLPSVSASHSSAPSQFVSSLTSEEVSKL